MSTILQFKNSKIYCYCTSKIIDNFYIKKYACDIIISRVIYQKVELYTRKKNKQTNLILSLCSYGNNNKIK